jgi:CHAD domain-containing protein
MAKAEEITGLSSSMNAAENAAIILRARFEEMQNLLEKAMNFSDIDGVHDMRVAMRRLRNAVRDLRSVLKKKHYKRFNQKLKFLYDIVGAVRDEDVAIEALEKMRAKAAIAGDENVLQGIDHVLADHRENRIVGQAKMTDAFSGKLFAEMKEEFFGLLAAAENEPEAPEKTFAEIGSKVISQTLKRFCKLSDNLYTAYDFEALHRFRIASKRLRTALQLFGECWGEELDPFIEQVAKMQLLLGKVHDRDGWLTDLTHRVDATNEKILITDGLAVKWISAEMVAKRNEKYRLALALWKEWEANDLIGRLRQIVMNKKEMGEV